MNQAGKFGLVPGLPVFLRIDMLALSLEQSVSEDYRTPADSRRLVLGGRIK